MKRTLIIIGDRTYIADSAPGTEEEMFGNIFHIRSYLVDDHHGIPRIRLNYVDGSTELNVGHPYTIVEDVVVDEETETFPE